MWATKRNSGTNDASSYSYYQSWFALKHMFNDYKKLLSTFRKLGEVLKYATHSIKNIMII